MTSLTDFQLKLLSDAAQRSDGYVVLPADLAPATAERRIIRLLSRGLVEEVPATAKVPVWREANGKRLALHITPAGLKAVGIDRDEPQPRASLTEANLAALGFVRVRARPGTGYVIAAPVGPWMNSGPPASNGPSGGPGGAERGAAGPKLAVSTAESKLARVIALLRRKRGATIAELIAATGWQAHSVRGFLSGTVKKKLGLPVTSNKNAKDGERRYRIAGANDEGSR